MLIFEHSYMCCLLTIASYSYQVQGFSIPLFSWVYGWWNQHVESNPNLIKFNLYPQKDDNNYNETIILGNPGSLKESSYNGSLPLIMIIHGFLANEDGDFSQELKDAYLEMNTKSNILLVDWSKLSTPDAEVPAAFYHLSVDNVPVVGKAVGNFIKFLIDQKVLSSPENVHLVGHSLGAHVSAIAAQTVKKSTAKKIGRITGLDPAGPEFDDASKNTRLDKNDALFVDVVHSDQGELGYFGDLGQVDFYPNGGGPNQPNCTIVSELEGGVCSHSTSYKYFTKSVRNPNITACKCPHPEAIEQNCLHPCNKPVIFGEHCPTTARGDYYLEISL